MTGLSILPLSIPSPPADWQIPITIPIGQWLHAIIPAIGDSTIIQIHTYALCILAGIIAATALTSRRLTKRGGEPGVVVDVIIWAVPLGLVGARFYHVFTHYSDYFHPSADPWNINAPGNVWAIWDGGNALFGSLIGGAIGAYIGCRIAGVRLWSFADALAPGMLIAQALGRFGNYFNHELFGLPTSLPWGLDIPLPNAAVPIGLPDGTLFHPTFLYEMIWNVIGIVLLFALERSHSLGRRTIAGVSVPAPIAGPIRLQWGKLWAIYMIWYGLGRWWVESIRIDPSEIFLGVRTNVWAAWGAILLGIILFAVQTRRHPGREPSIYVPGREWKPAGALDSGETYSDEDEPGDDALVTPQSGKLATSGSGTTS